MTSMYRSVYKDVIYLNIVLIEVIISFVYYCRTNNGHFLSHWEIFSKKLYLYLRGYLGSIGFRSEESSLPELDLTQKAINTIIVIKMELIFDIEKIHSS